MTRAVVHFTDAETFGGSEEVILTLLAGLPDEGWKPILFHHDVPGIQRLVRAAADLGVSVHAVPRLARGSVWSAASPWIRAMTGSRPQAFHAHLSWPLGCRHALGLARLMRVPATIATSHLYFPLDGVRRAALKHRVQAACIDRYIAVSSEVRQRLCRDLQVPEARVRVVHNAIRMTGFRRGADSQLRRALTGGRDCPLVFTPARLHAQKGHLYLLEAAARVPDAVFVLAGDGPERAALEGRVAELRLSGRVRFLGQRHDIPELLAACDLFVLPSLYEGLPISVLEAMAAGRPVIATAIGGTDEAVVNGETGLLVPPRDAAALAAAIRLLLANRRYADALAAAGQSRAAAMFSSDAMVRGVARVYEEVLGT